MLGGPDPDRDLLSELGAPEDVEESLLSDLEERSPARTVVVGAEGFSGPSWQEPAAVEVGGELERRGPGPGERDVPAAFLTGVLLAGRGPGGALAGVVGLRDRRRASRS